MTAGSPSGTTPTASATTTISASTQSYPLTSTAKMKTIAAVPMANQVKSRPNSLIWRSSGVVSVWTSPMRLEMRPISVRLPVATTTPCPWPVVTSVPEWRIGSRSPSAASAGTGSSRFSAGTDSPVRIASSAESPRARSSRISAGTLSPASSTTTSPGTISRASTVCRSPSRTTTVCGAIMSLIASRARSALPSWMKPTMALTTTTMTMTTPSTTWPSSIAAMAAVRRK
ncbi:hypothetical protein D3C72_1521910 [compost metagenome]